MWPCSISSLSPKKLFVYCTDKLWKKNWKMKKKERNTVLRMNVQWTRLVKKSNRTFTLYYFISYQYFDKTVNENKADQYCVTWAVKEHIRLNLSIVDVIMLYVDISLLYIYSYSVTGSVRWIIKKSKKTKQKKERRMYENIT